MKYLVLLFFITLISCNKKDKTINAPNIIEAKCERIIISDSIDFPSIHFILSFKNNSDKNIILFTNSFYKKDHYENAGLMLSIDSITTPIGAMLKHNAVTIDASSEIKILFSYSPQYPNEWVKIDPSKNIRKELLQTVNKVHLKYHYNKELNNKALFDSKDKNNLFSIDEDFMIDQKDYKIIYQNNISMEEVIKLLK